MNQKTNKNMLHKKLILKLIMFRLTPPPPILQYPGYTVHRGTCFQTDILCLSIAM